MCVLIGLEIVHVRQFLHTSEAVDNDTKTKLRMEVVALFLFNCGLYLNIYFLF